MERLQSDQDETAEGDRKESSRTDFMENHTEQVKSCLNYKDPLRERLLARCLESYLEHKTVLQVQKRLN